MSTLSNLSSFFNEILPVFGFLLLLSGILFLVFLKNKLEQHFENMKRIGTDIRRIAERLEEDRHLRS